VGRPDWVIARSKTGGSEPCRRFVFELLHHLLERQLVLANENVHMVGHDDTRPTGEFLVRDDRGKRFSNHVSRRFIQGQNGVTQNLPSLIVERTNIATQWLNLLAAIMEVAQFSNRIATDGF
jgi:hypothetical protein